MIVGPDGDVLAGPLEGEEGILYADIDVRRARAGRAQFDPVGHYGRADIFQLSVDARPRRSVSFTETAASGEPGDVDPGAVAGE